MKKLLAVLMLISFPCLGADSVTKISDTELQVTHESVSIITKSSLEFQKKELESGIVAIRKRADDAQLTLDDVNSKLDQLR